jgi:hypothetical protein
MDVYCTPLACELVGQPENPLTRDEIERKFAALAHPALGKSGLLVSLHGFALSRVLQIFTSWPPPLGRSG